MPHLLTRGGGGDRPGSGDTPEARRTGTLDVSRRGRPRPSPAGAPRPLPRPTPLSRLNPGTLLLTWTVWTTTLLLRPQWSTLAVVGGVLAVATLVARIPVRAVPCPPVWVWSGIVGGFIGAGVSGAFWLFLRASCVALLVLWGTALILWTTPAMRMTAALSRMLRPSARLGVPARDWARVMGLSVRGLPVMADQLRVISDTVRLRTRDLTAPGQGFVSLGLDVLTASLSAASRTAADTGRAMSVRGGHPPLSTDSVRVGVGDVVVVLVCVGTTVAIALIP